MLQEDRRVPDIVYSVIIGVVLLLAIFTHLPSFCHTVRDWRRPSNVSLIYRNLLVADSLLMFVTIPLDIYWTLTRHDQAVCKLMKGNLFLVFFAACNLLIILAVDRYLLATGQAGICSDVLQLINYLWCHELSEVCGHLLPHEAPHTGLQAGAGPGDLHQLAVLPGHGGVAGPGAPRGPQHQVSLMSRDI